MGRSGWRLTIGLLGFALGACSLTPLDDLQEPSGTGGAGTSASNGSPESASAASGATASGSSAISSANSGTSVSSQVSSSDASQSSAGGSTTGSGGGGGTPTSAYAEAVLADGPIAYLRLDESAGESTVVDSVGDFDGTLAGGVFPGEPGAIANEGTSIKFDGTSGMLSLGDVLDFEGGGPFSVELWVKTGPETPSEIEWLFSKEADFGGDRKGYSCLVSPDLSLGAEVWAGFPPTVAYFDGPLMKETWHHVVMTASATALHVWVNGVAYDDGGDASALIDNDGALTFAAQTGGQGHFDGWLDEIAVYEIELTSAQIAAHIAAAQ